MALLLPLSGPSAGVGRDLLDAAQLALFAHDTDLVLLPRDTGGTPEGARRAMEQALAAGAEFVLGPLFARSTRAVAPLAARAGVLVLSFSNDASVAGKQVFVLGFRPEEQVERIVRYAIREGYARIAGLFPDDAYGQRARDAWRRTLEQNGALAAPQLLYGRDEMATAEALRAFTAFEERKRALEREKAALRARNDEAARRALAELATRDTFGPPPFDAVLIADGGLGLRAIVALLQYYDVPAPQVRYLGTERWIVEDPALASRPDFEGAWLSTADPAQHQAFVAHFRRVYDRTPDPLAPLAYDAVSLAALLARATPRFSRAELVSPEGFAGYSGILRLRPDGLAEHGLAVLEVRDGQLTVRDPAPKSFPAGFARLSGRRAFRAAPPSPARSG